MPGQTIPGPLLIAAAGRVSGGHACWPRCPGCLPGSPGVSRAGPTGQMHEVPEETGERNITASTWLALTACCELGSWGDHGHETGCTFDRGVITTEEFNRQKAKILA